MPNAPESIARASSIEHRDAGQALIAMLDALVSFSLEAEAISYPRTVKGGYSLMVKHAIHDGWIRVRFLVAL